MFVTFYQYVEMRGGWRRAQTGQAVTTANVIYIWVCTGQVLQQSYSLRGSV